MHHHRNNDATFVKGLFCKVVIRIQMATFWATSGQPLTFWDFWAFWATLWHLDNLGGTSGGPLGDLWATPGCPSGQILGNFLGDLWETALFYLRKPCIGNVRVEALYIIRDQWWRNDSFYFPRLSNKMVKLYFLLLLFHSEKNRGQKIGNIMEDYLGNRT